MIWYFMLLLGLHLKNGFWSTLFMVLLDSKSDEDEDYVVLKA